MEAEEMKSYVLGILGFFTLMGIAKAGADARLFGDPSVPLWLAFGSSKWFIGGASYSQGSLWSCDFWHLMDGHLRQLFAAGAVAWTAWVRPRFTRLWELAVLVLACYWIEGLMFKLFYKVVFMGEWSFWDFLGSIL
jgi:hypothetical protein